jgi:uncharacterized protein YjbI with pentapeptide repeats
LRIEENNEFWSEKFEAGEFSGQAFSAKEFDGCTFTGCNFSDTTFKRCNFVDCEFIQCNLSNVKFEYSKISDVSFHESKLIGVDWTKVSWSKFVRTSPLKFYQSILNDGSFYGLSLHELIMDQCKAHHVDFRGGDFSHANFGYTDFTGSTFNNTKLTGADFSEATGYDIDIYHNEIKRAKFSRFEAVRLLEGLDIELVD